MTEFPSSTYFTVSPDWGWLIVCYFFFGGLAGGCYFLAVLIDFFGRPEDRPLARLGHLISFPCIIISGILLTVDLYRPERFSADVQILVADVGGLLGDHDLRTIFFPVFSQRAGR